MHKQRLSKPWSGQPEESPELVEELRQSAKAPKPTIGNVLRLPVRFIRNRLHRMRQEQAQDLDENGLPIEWRHNEPYPIFKPFQGVYWQRFEAWCTDRHVKSIPASAETLLEYLSELEPPDRFDAYQAIANKHESIYWHTGACPHCELWIGYGMSMKDGRISFRERAGALERFGSRIDE